MNINTTQYNQWEISQLPGPKVLGRTATFLISFISSMYNWDILKIRKLPEFQTIWEFYNQTFGGYRLAKP